MAFFFTYGLSFFYTCLLGIVLGSLMQHLWPKADEPEMLAELDNSRTRAELGGASTGDKSGLTVSITPLSPYTAHADKLIEQYLRELALDPAKFTLLELRVANARKEGSVTLEERDGLAVLLDAQGTGHRSKPLPRTATDDAMKRRLAQCRPEGVLPAGTMRHFWLLFDKPLNFEELKSGTLTFVGGEKVALTLKAAE